MGRFPGRGVEADKTGREGWRELFPVEGEGEEVVNPTTALPVIITVPEEEVEEASGVRPWEGWEELRTTPRLRAMA